MFNKSDIQQHSLDMRQFIDFRQSTLPNGSRIIEAYNTSGLNFTILPDRGFDIWTASYKGIPLTWVSPGAPFLPDNGATWLQQFNGGLLTTCGLRHVGPPENDTETGDFRDLHGRFSRLRAMDVNHSGKWTDDTTYSAQLTSTIHEVQLHSEQLTLTRTYHLNHIDPVITIEDTITNAGDKPEPLMLLYHVNVGYPLVQQGTQLVTPHHAVYSRESGSQVTDSSWAEYAKAVSQFPEEVYFHQLNADDQHQTAILLHNSEIGVRLAYDNRQLPYFSQWKNTRNGMYVNGIEPGNCIPEGQNSARENNRLDHLQPGETRTYSLKIEIIEGDDALQQAKTHITGLNANPAAGFEQY